MLGMSPILVSAIRDSGFRGFQTPVRLLTVKWSFILRYEAEKSTYLTELDVRKPLVVSIFHKEVIICDSKAYFRICSNPGSIVSSSNAPAGRTVTSSVALIWAVFEDEAKTYVWAPMSRLTNSFVASRL
jgi:hypothetical protein